MGLCEPLIAALVYVGIFGEFYAHFFGMKSPGGPVNLVGACRVGSFQNGRTQTPERS
jgi:hypothetical protein